MSHGPLGVQFWNDIGSQAPRPRDLGLGREVGIFCCGLAHSLAEGEVEAKARVRGCTKTRVCARHQASD